MSDVIAPTHTLSAESGIKETRLCFTLQHWCLWQSEEFPLGVNTVDLNGAEPSPEGEGWVRGNQHRKKSLFYPPHPSLLPQGEGAHVLKSTVLSPGVHWPGGEVLPYNGGSADVGFLPMMQSRRLSPLARAACAVANHCRQKSGDMPSVFFSSHGESQYYFEMLHGIAAREDVSPSRFSLCVHNAIAGLSSSFHSTSFLPYVSLSGGTEGMFAAFLEVGGMLLETPKVLVVWYEQPLPDAYRAYLATSETTWALAMVLTRAGNPSHQLRLVRRQGKGLKAEDSAESLVQAILENRRSSLCHLDRSIWQWSLDDV